MLSTMHVQNTVSVVNKLQSITTLYPGTDR